MAAAIALGGFTGPEADTLGYAIRKKKSAVLRAQKEKFVTQAAERGVEPQIIDAVFKAFEPFERYGFNKAHATCYGLIAYQTAYLKANYTVEYMTSVLTAFRTTRRRSRPRSPSADGSGSRCGRRTSTPASSSSPSRVTPSGSACSRSRTSVRAPSNRSSRPARPRRRVPLADRLLHPDRPAPGQSQGPRGAHQGRRAQRVRPPGPDPARARRCDRGRRRRPSATGSAARPRCFDMGAADAAALERPLPPTPEVPGPRAPALGEGTPRAVPVGASDGRGRGAVSATSSPPTRRPQGRVARWAAGRRRRDRRPGSGSIITKAQATMAVVTLEDLQGSIEVVVFPRLYEQTGPIWREGAILLVAGRIDHRGDEVSLLADLVATWDEAVVKGNEAFARDVAAGDRGAFRRRPGAPGQSADGNGVAESGPVRARQRRAQRGERQRHQREWLDRVRLTWQPDSGTCPSYRTAIDRVCIAAPVRCGRGGPLGRRACPDRACRTDSGSRTRGRAWPGSQARSR